MSVPSNESFLPALMRRIGTMILGSDASKPREPQTRTVSYSHDDSHLIFAENKIREVFDPIIEALNQNTPPTPNGAKYRLSVLLDGDLDWATATIGHFSDNEAAASHAFRMTDICVKVGSFADRSRWQAPDGEQITRETVIRNSIEFYVDANRPRRNDPDYFILATTEDYGTGETPRSLAYIIQLVADTFATGDKLDKFLLAAKASEASSNATRNPARPSQRPILDSDPGIDSGP